MKVVIDPNVLVSAAVASGASSQLIDRWLTERPFELVVCPMLIDELRDVLARDNGFGSKRVISYLISSSTALGTGSRSTTTGRPSSVVAISRTWPPLVMVSRRCQLDRDAVDDRDA